jgi:peptidoglycan/LPS O-acetylase OafA/YrhL
MLVVAYLLLSLLVALCGRHRRSGFVGAFFMALLITPILAFLVLYLTAPSSSTVAVNGDGRRGSSLRPS